MHMKLPTIGSGIFLYRDILFLISKHNQPLHQQPVFLNAFQNTKDWHKHLFLIERNGEPVLILANIDKRQNVTLMEIGAAQAIEYIRAGHDQYSGTQAVQTFGNVLKEHHYPSAGKLTQVEVSHQVMLTPSTGNSQKGLAYAEALEGMNLKTLADMKQKISNIMDSIEHSMNKSPAIPKALGMASLVPAFYEIGKQSYEAGKEGFQSGMTTATQGLAELTVSLEAGAMASPYALPLLEVAPYSAAAYIGYTTLAAISASQAMKTLETSAIWAWQELAVEPLRTQAEAREAEKARQAIAQREHEAILTKIPDDPPPSKSQAELVAQQVAINAARSGWSTQEVLTAVNIASAHIMQQTNPKLSPIDSSPLYPELIAL